VSRPRSITASLLCATLVILLAGSQISIGAQQQDQSTPAPEATARGIELYRKGDLAEALTALRAAVQKNKNDISAWHYLGLTLQRQSDLNAASKAHEQAAKLGEKLLLNLWGTNVDSASLLQFKSQIADAADSADKFIELRAKPLRAKTDEWSERAELLHDFIEFLAVQNSNEAQHKIFSAREVTTKARILSKPEAQYTQEARENQVQGTIVLRAVLSADGKVRGVIPIKSLPHGLTRNTIQVARQIKFTPATIDGQPVSQFILIEYNFSLY
jgi:TonB family protein